MASYSNDSLDQLLKQGWDIPIVLSLQSKLDEANNEANNKLWRRYVIYQILLPN